MRFGNRQRCEVVCPWGSLLPVSKITHFGPKYPFFCEKVKKRKIDKLQMKLQRQPEVIKPIERTLKLHRASFSKKKEKII